MKNAFLLRTKEDADFNQYWYSQPTIDSLVKEVEHAGMRAAFLSTPSVYFSLTKGSSVRDNSWVFDCDDRFSKDAHYVKYDFNSPELIPAELHHTFDVVVIDPPFITDDVWRKYASTAKLLLKPEGKVIASTIIENQELLKDLFGAEPCRFQPYIPNLVYQYNFFTNYEAKFLSIKNAEVAGEEDCVDDVCIKAVH